MDEQIQIPENNGPIFVTPFQTPPEQTEQDTTAEESALSPGRTLLKSLLYAALSLIPGFLVGITISLVLMSVVIVSLEGAITSHSFNQKTAWLAPIAISAGSYYWIPMLLVFAFGIVYFFTYLKIFNPNFSRKAIKSLGISYWRLILWFFISGLLIAIVAGLLQYIHIFLLLLTGTLLFWILWHEYGLWGSFAQFKKDSATRIKLFSRANLMRGRGWKRVLVHGAIYSAWAYLLNVLSTDTFRFLLKIAGSVGSETLWFSPVKFFPLLILGFFGTAATLPLIFALSNIKLNAKNIAIRLIVPVLVTTFVLGLWKYVRFDITEAYDYDKDFVALTKIDESESGLAVLEFEDDGPKIYSTKTNFPVIELATTANPPSLWQIWKVANDQDVDTDISVQDFAPNCTTQNIEKAESLRPYLSGKDYQSALSLPYFEYLSGYSFGGCYGQNWEISKVLETRFLNFQKTNSVIYGLMAAARRGTGFAQVKPEYRAWADKIADDESFYIGAGAARNSGDLYYHYGELEKAQEWYDKALELGADRSNIPSDLPLVFTGGYLTGQLFFNDKPAKGVKIGLKIDNAFPSEETGRKYNFGLAPNTADPGSGRSLVAVTTADEYGRFFFPKLIAGEYYLAILLPDSDFDLENSQYVLESEFSTLVIGETTPLISLGQIAFVETDFKIDESKLAEEYRDTDNDGLPDREESYYYADLNNPDTDSDGFSDGEELNRGFSPVEGGPAVYYPRDWNASAASQ